MEIIGYMTYLNELAIWHAENDRGQDICNVAV